MVKNQTGLPELDVVNDNPAVMQVYAEGDGLIMELARGQSDGNEPHGCHGSDLGHWVYAESVKELLEAVATIRPCDCWACTCDCECCQHPLPVQLVDGSWLSKEEFQKRFK